MLKKVLIYLFIVQEVDNRRRVRRGLSRLGRGGYKASRLNPYNPLSYILLIGLFIVGVVLFGVCGIREEFPNPFRWN